MQNLVVFMDPCEDAYDISVKDGNKLLNRFCIDEDAAFHLKLIHQKERTIRANNVSLTLNGIDV